MIDVKILKKPKQGVGASGSGGFATGAASVGSDCLLRLARVLMPVDREGTELSWDAPLDQIFALKSVKGIYTDEFLSARGLNPFEGEGVTAGIDEKQLALYLVNNNYAKKTDIPDLTPYAKKTDIPSLTGYAKTADIQQWVEGKGYLTDYTIHALTLQPGAFSAKTYDPKTAAQTVNIPTTTSHITEGTRLYFTDARAQSALSGHTGDGTIHITANERTAWNAKLDKSVYDTFKSGYDTWKSAIDAFVTRLNSMFELETDAGSPDGKRIKARFGLYSPYYISARGANPSGNGSGGGLVQNVYGWSGLGRSFSDSTLTDTFNAYTIKKIYTDLASRIDNLPTTSVNPFALTIQKNGVTVKSYDGSAAVTADITIGWADTASGRPSWIGASKPSYSFSEIGSRPTTLDGYGITDAVAQVAGKGLSANDFTDALLTKLNGIEAGANKYTHPTGGANTTVAAANGKVLSAITVNSLGHVTSVSSKTLAAADIPTLAISKTSGLQTALDAKLEKTVYETFISKFNDMFELETVGGVKRIKALHGLYTDEFLSARGLNPDGSGSGSAWGLMRTWPASAPANTTTDALGANLGWALRTGMNTNASNITALTSRVTALEGKNYLDALSLTASGAGNAVTAVALSSDKKTLTVTKGSTFLTAHQTLYTLTVQKNGTQVGTFKPNANATINISDVASAATLSDHTGNADIHFSADERTKLDGIEAGANKYTHPTATATTIAAATGKVLSAITVNSLGHVTSVSSKTLAAADIPSLDWSKITGGKPTTLAGYGITDAYTKTEADNRYVNVEGDTMTGTLTIGIDTASVNHLAFSRASWNYISATKSGGILVFCTNGVSPSSTSGTLYLEGKNGRPGQNNTGSWGTSSLRWSNLYSVLGNFSGLLTASGGIEIASGKKLKIGSITLEEVNGNLHIDKGVYSDSFVSARGANTGGSGGGVSFGRLDDWKDYDAKGTDALSAVLGYGLKSDISGLATRVTSLEGGSALSVTTTGSGNAVTAVSKSGTAITVTKGTTFSLSTHTHSQYLTAITKAQVEAVLTGDITSHTHSAYAAASHTHAYITNGGKLTAVTGATLGAAGLHLNSVYNNGYPTAFGNLLRVGGSGYGELLLGWTGSTTAGSLYYRSKRDVAATEWSDWVTLLTSANIGSHALTASNYADTLGSVYQTKGSYVTTDTAQTISGAKTFSAAIVSSQNNATNWWLSTTPRGKFVATNGGNTSGWSPVLGFKTVTGKCEIGSLGDSVYINYYLDTRTSNSYDHQLTVPKKTGTLAVTSDISSAVANYLPLTGGTLTGALTVPTLTVSNTEAKAHIAFSRGGFNYFTAPASGLFSFVTNGKAVGEANSDLLIENNILRPGTTNAVALGKSDKRWSNVYSTLGNFSGLVTASAGIKIGDVTITYDSANKGLKISGGGLYSESYISAKGANTSGSSGGSGVSYDRLDAWADYTTGKAGYVLSAKLGYDLYQNKLDKTAGVTSVGVGTGDNASKLSWVKNGTTSYITVPYATKAAMLQNNTALTYGASGVQWFNISGTAGCVAKVNDTPTTAWWHILRFNHANSGGYYTDLAVPFNANSLYYKRVANGALANDHWVRLVDDLNYTSIVTKIGTATVGSTSKPVYLNAGTPTALSATVGSASRPVYLNAGTITAGTYTFGNASGNAPVSNGTVNTNLNADMLDGRHASGFCWRKSLGTQTDSKGAYVLLAPAYNGTVLTGGFFYGTVYITRGGSGQFNAKTAVMVQCGGQYNSNIAQYQVLSSSVTVNGLYRIVYDGVAYIALKMAATSTMNFVVEGYWSGIDPILVVDGDAKITSSEAFISTPSISSNATTATKLATARTLWGKSFDGSANVSGDLTSVGNITGSGAMTVKANGRLTLNATATAVDLKFNNENARSVILNGAAFKPFDDANGNLTLGSTTARWSNVFSVLGNFSGKLTADSGDFNGQLKADTIVIENSATEAHLEFSRDGYNYLTAPEEGLFAFVANNKSLGEANSDLIVEDKCVRPGATATVSLGSSAKVWKEVYARNYRSDTTAYLSSGMTSTSILFCLGTTEVARLAQPNGYLGLGISSPAYRLDVLGSQRLASSVAGAGGEVALQLWRGTNASWRMLNTGGTLKFQSNYTDKTGDWFDCMTLAYNTGDVAVKGTLTPMVNRSKALGGTNLRWTVGYFAQSVVSTATTLDMAAPLSTAIVNGGYLELYHATPYIDFHFGNSTADYTTRLIEEASGRLKVIGTLRVTTGMYSDGYVSARGQNTSSDARLKSGLRPLTLDVRRIAAAPSVRFRWRGDGTEDVGSIAQYWRGVCPELAPDMPDGTMGLQYGKAALLGVVAVARETLSLGERLRRAEVRIGALERENVELKRKLEKAK